MTTVVDNILNCMLRKLHHFDGWTCRIISQSYLDDQIIVGFNLQSRKGYYLLARKQW